MEEAKDNSTTHSTSHSPTPSYTDSSTDSTIDSPSPDLDSFTDSSDGSQDSIFESTFESMDHLVLAELLEPPQHFTADGTADFPLPEVGLHWKDLNNYDANGEMREEETSGEEKGHDGDASIGGDEEESGECATEEEITEFIVEEYQRDAKKFYPRGHLLWKKFGRRGDKSTTAMIKLYVLFSTLSVILDSIFWFRTRISPRLIELTLPKELHLGLLKKARTTIGCEEKEALENIHGVTIILNPKGRIEKWSQKSQGARGEGQVVGSVKVVNRLVDYSSSEDEPSE
ncbi:hypothetical protein CAEBREN_16088 [Caenorhabditis brenneri]|uniref:Uncharacterized protein n=1 Tax=Caenorhabditis brenneri TaxID=135651 RepID=G0P0B9_CAEBE|nr:hypothetical protein CAEBREN_16088 [Caenorhabditis brenneri]